MNKKNTQNSEIKIAENVDIPELVELMQEFYDESDYPLDRGKASDAFQTLLSNRIWGEVLLAEVDGKTAGYIVITFYFAMGNYGYSARIDDLFVRKNFRGRGIGEEMVLKSLKMLEEKGIKHSCVEVGRENNPAITLYKKSGYCPQDNGIISMNREGL